MKNRLFLLILIVIICFSLFHTPFNLESFKENSYGFIITRHVNNESANKIWLSCVTNIRKYYPDTPIVIIDDNSSYEFISYPDNFLDNCIVIESEFKGSGELLSYYYFYHNNWFKKAIYIHDSVFIHGPIDISNVNNVKFLWEFNSTEIYEERPYTEEYLGYLNYSNELLKLFNTNDWVGCFGVMTVIDHEYVKHLADKYNLFILLDHVKSRMGRTSIERIIGLLCFHDKELNKENASIYGNYAIAHCGRNYDTYLEDLDKGLINSNPIKLYFGR
jgi:hypothetical protein